MDQLTQAYLCVLVIDSAPNEYSVHLTADEAFAHLDAKNREMIGEADEEEYELCLDPAFHKPLKKWDGEEHLEVYDSNGEKIAELVKLTLPSGRV